MKKTFKSPAKDPHKKRRAFTSEEDETLIDLVSVYGEKNWKTISLRMKKRNARQCRDRWVHYLTPHITDVIWSRDDDAELLRVTQKVGKKWSVLKKYFPGRSEVNIKNRLIFLSHRVPELNEEKNDSQETSSGVSLKNIKYENCSGEVNKRTSSNEENIKQDETAQIILSKKTFLNMNNLLRVNSVSGERYNIEKVGSKSENYEFDETACFLFGESTAKGTLQAGKIGPIDEEEYFEI